MSFCLLERLGMPARCADSGGGQRRLRNSEFQTDSIRTTELPDRMRQNEAHDRACIYFVDQLAKNLLAGSLSAHRSTIDVWLSLIVTLHESFSSIIAST